MKVRLEGCFCCTQTHDCEDLRTHHPRVQEIVGLLRSFEYTQRPDARWMVRPHYFTMDHVEVHVALEVPVKCVESGTQIKLYTGYRPISIDYPDDHVVYMIHTIFKDFELHELDEHLFFRGIKLWDPHRKEKNLKNLDAAAPVINPPLPVEKHPKNFTS